MNFLKSNLKFLQTLGLNPYRFEVLTGIRQSVIYNFINNEDRDITVNTLLTIYPIIKEKLNITLDDLIYKDLSKN